MKTEGVVLSQHMQERAPDYDQCDCPRLNSGWRKNDYADDVGGRKTVKMEERVPEERRIE